MCRQLKNPFNPKNFGLTGITLKSPAKRLGSGIEPTATLVAGEENTLKQIALLKFKQKDQLGKRLRACPYKHFYECTIDGKWGCNYSLNPSQRQIDPSNFTGENKFGKILDEIKKSLLEKS